MLWAHGSMRWTRGTFHREGFIAWSLWTRTRGFAGRGSKDPQKGMKPSAYRHVLTHLLSVLIYQFSVISMSDATNVDAIDRAPAFQSEGTG